MTLNDIEQIEDEILTPAEVAPYLGCDQNEIRYQARKQAVENSNLLGFPVVLIGNRVKIPKEGFLNYCRGVRPHRDLTGKCLTPDGKFVDVSDL